MAPWLMSKFIAWVVTRLPRACDDSLPTGRKGNSVGEGANTGGCRTADATIATRRIATRRIHISKAGSHAATHGSQRLRFDNVMQCVSTCA